MGRPAVIWIAFLALLTACSAEGGRSGGSPDGNAGSGNGGTGVGGASGSGGVPGGAGGSAGAAGFGGGAGGSGSGGGTSGAGGSDCGGDSYEAEQRQLDMYVMFDESGSMVPLWPFVTEAFATFINDPRSEGIGVGLQFFGPDGQCDAAYYAEPRVPIAPLPGNASMLQTAFPIIPVSGTPTRPAMEGAVDHAQSWAMSHPDSKVVVLLVTDGAPDECMSTVDNVAAAAQEGLEGSPSIPTYVIGLGNGLALDQIAQAGGTDEAFLLDLAQVTNSSDALVETMNQIRTQALPCDYALPDETEDTSLVNLQLEPQGGAPMQIPKVPDEASCDPDRGGWYYNADETRLIACPRTCEQFRAAGNARVDVVLGCPTVVIE